MKFFASILAVLTLAFASSALVSAIAQTSELPATQTQSREPQESEVKQRTTQDEVGETRDYQREPGSTSAAPAPVTISPPLVAAGVTAQGESAPRRHLNRRDQTCLDAASLTRAQAEARAESDARMDAAAADLVVGILSAAQPRNQVIAPTPEIDHATGSDANEAERADDESACPDRAN